MLKGAEQKCVPWRLCMVIETNVSTLFCGTSIHLFSRIKSKNYSETRLDNKLGQIMGPSRNKSFDHRC